MEETVIPVTGDTEELLIIPVTGMELVLDYANLKQILFSGMLLFGAALLLEGVSRRFRI